MMVVYILIFIAKCTNDGEYWYCWPHDCSSTLIQCYDKKAFQFTLQSTLCYNGNQVHLDYDECKDFTIKPTTIAPPTTVKPTTFRPTTVKPITVKPTTVKPTTVKATTFKPTTTVKPISESNNDNSMSSELLTTIIICVIALTLTIVISIIIYQKKLIKIRTTHV